MEDLVAAMKSMAAALEAVKSTVDDFHSSLKELVAGQPQDDDTMQEVLADINSNTSSPDDAVPAKCSTFCVEPDIGGVEAVASSLQSSTASATFPVPAGVSMSPSMQLIIALKPDASTPTTCSTDVLDIDTDAMRAKRDTDSLRAGLMSTPTSAAAMLPTTTPPHPTDQASLLLARPPPWPVWMESCVHSTMHRCAWLLPMRSSSPLLSSTATAPSSTLTPAPALPSVRPWVKPPLRVEGKQGHRHLFCLLLLSACGKAECLGGVKGLCTSSIAPPHVLTPLPEHMPEPAPPALTLRHKVQWCLWCMVIPSGLLDMGKHIQRFSSYSLVLGDTVIIFTDRGDHPFVPPGYNTSSDHGASILKDILVSALLQIVDNQLKLPFVPGVHGLMAAKSFTKRFADSPIFRNGSVNQADNRSYHLENLHMCSMQHVLILVASNQGVEISRDMSLSATWYLFVCPSILHYQVLAVSAGAHEGIFSWWQTAGLKVDRITKPDLRFKGEYIGATVGKEIRCSCYTLRAYSASNVQLLPSDLEKAAYSHKLELHQELRPKMFSSPSTSSTAGTTERILLFGAPTEISPCKIQLQQKLGDWYEPRITFPRCSSGMGMTATCLVFVHLTHPSAASATCEIPLPRPSPDFLAVCGDRIGNLVMLSVSITMSWDPGINNQLIREVVLHGPSQQALADILITPIDSLAHRQCTWPLHWNHLGAQFLFALIMGPSHDDQVGCEDSLSPTLPWDPGKLLCLELGFTHPTGEQLRQSPSDKLNQLSAVVHRLWDPSDSSRRPAWGQAGFQGGGNVTTWIASWAAVGVG